MDVFFEQLVRVKRSLAETILMVLSVIAAVSISVILFIFAEFFPILIVVIVGVIYGEWKLLGFFYKEYEYIITNGTVDVDRIIGKSSRKRVISFECSDIERVGRYNPKHPPVTDAKEIYNCAAGDAYYVLAKKGSRKILVIASFNEKLLDGIKKCLGKHAYFEI